MQGLFLFFFMPGHLDSDRTHFSFSTIFAFCSGLGGPHSIKAYLFRASTICTHLSLPSRISSALTTTLYLKIVGLNLFRLIILIPVIHQQVIELEGNLKISLKLQFFYALPLKFWFFDSKCSSNSTHKYCPAL